MIRRFLNAEISVRHLVDEISHVYYDLWVIFVSNQVELFSINGIYFVKSAFTKLYEKLCVCLAVCTCRHQINVIRIRKHLLHSVLVPILLDFPDDTC
jgi:hypothetical protein